MKYLPILFLLMLPLLVSCTKQFTTEEIFEAKISQLELHTELDGTRIRSGFNDEGRYATVIGILLLVTEETPREVMLADALTVLRAGKPLLRKNKEIDAVGIFFALPNLDEQGNIKQGENGGAIGVSMLEIGILSEILLKTNLTNFNPVDLTKLTFLYKDNIDEVLARLAQERDV